MIKKGDPKTEFGILLHGVKYIPVDEEVYHAYYRPIGRELAYRRMKKKRHIPYDMYIQDLIDYKVVSKENSVEFIVEEKFKRERLESALVQLPEKAQYIFKSYYYLGKSEPAIAKSLNITQQAVSAAIHRYLKKLREILDEEDFY